MSITLRAEAIAKLRPNAKWIMYGEDITWQDESQTQPTEDEITAKATELENAEPLKLLRAERNTKLAETDWTQNRDVTLSNDADWKTYRQALRDITKGLDSVEKVQEKMKFDTKTKTHVNFPKKPS